MERDHDLHFIYDVGCYVIHTHTRQSRFIAEGKFEIDAVFVLLLNRQVKP